MLNDDLSFCNKEYDVKSNLTHFDSPCALACYPKIIDRLVSLNKVFRMDKYNIVVIRHQSLLSDLKDRPDPVGYLEIDVSSDLDPIKNKYGSVQTSTRLLVNKAPSCLDCPTPSSVHNDAKNGGVIPQEFNPVITQSSARETLLDKPDILVGDLVDLVGSSPPVDLSTESSSVNSDNFMVQKILGSFLARYLQSLL